MGAKSECYCRERRAPRGRGRGTGAHTLVLVSVRTMSGRGEGWGKPNQQDTHLALAKQPGLQEANSFRRQLLGLPNLTLCYKQKPSTAIPPLPYLQLQESQTGFSSVSSFLHRNLCLWLRMMPAPCCWGSPVPSFRKKDAHTGPYGRVMVGVPDGSLAHLHYFRREKEVRAERF